MTNRVRRVPKYVMNWLESAQIIRYIFARMIPPPAPRTEPIKFTHADCYAFGKSVGEGLIAGIDNTP